MLETTEAIILNSRKYGDSSKLVTMFSRKYGRFTSLAKGAFQTKSKFGSTLEPLSYNSVTFYKKPAGQLQLLSSTDTIKNFWNISKSLDHLSIGLAIIETLDKCLEDNYPNENIFTTTSEVLGYLNDLPLNPYSFYVKFAFNLSDNLGLGFGFQKEDAKLNNYYFDVENGLFIEGYLNSENRILFRLNKEILEKLKIVSNTEMINVDEIVFTNAEFKTFCNLLSRYFHYHLDKYFILDSLKLFNL